MSRVFNFSLLLSSGKNNSHFKLIKVYQPKFELIVKSSRCEICNTVAQFFKQFDLTLNIRTLKRFEETPTQFPSLQYSFQDVVYEVPLPKLNGSASKTILFRLKDWFTIKPKIPRQHQLDLITSFQDKDLNQKNTPAFTIFWEMGSGKTFGTTNLLIQKLSNTNLIVCTNSNIEYWVQHAQSTPFTTGSHPNQVLSFDVIGYTEFRSSFDEPRKVKQFSTIVLDEAHYYRNNTKTMTNAINVVRSIKNVILLTGTPLVNDVEDIVGMMELTDVTKKFKGNITPQSILPFLKNNVSWFDPKIHRPLMFQNHYPKVIEIITKVPMTYVQSWQYFMAMKSQFKLGDYIIQQGHSNRYNCLTRAICNISKTNESPKLNHIAQDILTNCKLGPQVVHTPLIDQGLNKLIDIITNLNPNISYNCITGKTSNDLRDIIRKNYNKGKYQILFISNACQYGLDLLKTHDIYLSEPHENKSTENQTSARAIRMGSHDNCNYNKVFKHKYISIFPKSKMPKKDVELCKQYFIKSQILGKDTEQLLKGINIAKEFQHYLKLCNFKTINEIQEEHNITKQTEIEPFLQSYRNASVNMSIQKGMEMFVDEETGCILTKPIEKKIKSKKLVFDFDPITNEKLIFDLVT